MDARKITKYAADMVATAVVKKALTSAAHAAAPSTKDHEMITDIATGVTAYALVSHFGTQLEAAVDSVFDKIEARKAKKNPTPEN